jgi:HEAT repeat protein
MNNTVILARQFAQLTWLLHHEPTNTEEQKTALRALHNTAKLGAVSLSATDEGLQANGENVPRVLTGVQDLLWQLARHGLAMVTVEMNAKPADLLAAARIVAGMPVIDDGGTAAEEKRLAAGANTVRFAARPRLASDHAPEQAPAPPKPSLDGMEFGEVFDDPLEQAKLRATPRSTQAIKAAGERRGGGGLFEQFAAVRVPTESYDVVLARVENTLDPAVIARGLEDLMVLGAEATKEGQLYVAAEIMARLAHREPQLTHFEDRRLIAMALQKLAKPDVLRHVAAQLPHDEASRDENIGVLVRAGDAGADALVEQMATATHQGDRRIYVDALARTEAGTPSLLRALNDPRWFVVRHAAAALGELQVADAEAPLNELLQHGEERVRKAATVALMRLGTPRALEMIQRALTDPLPQTRIQAAAALAARKDVRTTSPYLLKALEGEKDDAVQSAFLMALGRLATPDAVHRLVAAAAPKKGLFDRKTTAYRLSAVNALGEALTAESLAALKTLTTDKDADVRVAATFAIARHSRTQPQAAHPSAGWHDDG